MGTSGAGVLKDRLRKDHPHAYGDKDRLGNYKLCP